MLGWQTHGKHSKLTLNCAPPQEQAALLYEESQARLRLQMEVDAKDSEVEQLQRRLASLSADTASVTSSCPDTTQTGTFTGSPRLKNDLKSPDLALWSPEKWSFLEKS